MNIQLRPDPEIRVEKIKIDDITALVLRPAKEAGVEAEADVYHSDTHAFDMLYPEREESKAAIGRFEEHFGYALTHYFAPQKK